MTVATDRRWVDSKVISNGFDGVLDEAILSTVSVCCIDVTDHVANVDVVVYQEAVFLL